MKFSPLNLFANFFSKNLIAVLALLLSLFIGQNVQAQVCGVNAGINTTICSNVGLNLAGNQSGSFLVNPTWTLVSGPNTPFIVNPTSVNSAVLGTVAGTYVFQFAGVCSDAVAASQTVTWVLNGVTQATAGPDQLNCPGTYSLAANAPGSGETGAWSTPVNAGGVTVNTLSSPTSTVTLPTSSAGVSMLVWTITKTASGCTSRDTLFITNYGGVVPVDAGANQTLSNCYSGTTTANLAATFAGTGFAGQQGVWSVVSGPNYPTFSSTTTNTATLTNLIAGTYKFLWTVSGPCGAGFDSVKITVPNQSVDGAATASNPGATINTCNNVTSFNMNANVPLNIHETGTWAFVSGPTTPTIVSANSPTTSLTGLTGTGSWVLSWTINNTTTGCNSSANITINKYANTPALSINAGVDQTLGCDVTSAVIPFTTTGPSGISTNVRYISGPIAVPPAGFTGTGSPYTWSGLTTAGQYILEIQNVGPTGTNCTLGSVTDQVAITVSRAAPTQANAGTDQFVPCNATSMTMAGQNMSAVNPGVTGTWTQIGGAVALTITNPNNPNTTVTSITPLNPGPYTFRWTLTGGNGCTVLSDDMTIFVASLVPSAANGGPDGTVCSGGTYLTAGNTTAQGETGLWTVSPAGPVIACTTCPSTTVTGFAANTTYKFVWRHLNVCNTVTDTVVITSNSTTSAPKANAGPNQCKASGSTSATMAGNAPGAGTGLWTRISGPNTPTITTPSSPTTTITGMINGTYLYAWTITQPACGNPTIDTVQITISSAATVSDAGPNQNICGSSATLAGNTITTGVGTWSQKRGPSIVTFSNVLSPTSTVSNMTIGGQYVFNWTVTNGACSGNTDSVIINVSPTVTTANAGPDQSRCVANATLAANTATVGSGSWIVVSGPNAPTFSSTTSPTATITNLVAGTYTLRWTISGGSCTPSTDDVLINVNIPANAGSNQNLCTATSVNLVGNTGSTGTWTQTAGPGGATITTTGGNSATVTSLVAGTYTFQFAVAGSFGCSASTSTMQVVNSAAPVAPNAGGDQNLCNQTTATLAGNNVSPSTGLWVVVTKPASAPAPTFTPNASTPTATINGLTTGTGGFGTYVLAWQSSNGNCSSQDVAIITNYALPTTANAGPNQTVCFTQATMAANLPTVGVGAWSFVSGPSTPTFTSTIQPGTLVTGLNTVGTYVLRWTITNGPTCTPSTSTVNLVVSAISPTLANAGPDVTVCNLSTMNLSGNTPTVGTGTWTNVAGNPSTATFGSASSPTTSVFGLIVGTYKFAWTTVNGDLSCSSKDTVKIINSPLPNTSNAGSNQTLCANVSVNLNGNAAISGVTGTWSQISGPTTVTFISPNSPTSGISGFTAGTYVFRWSLGSPGCTSSTSDVTYVFLTPPNTANAGTNQALCNVTTTTMAGNAATNPAVGTWSQISGPNSANIVTPTSPTSVINGLTFGTYVFRWRIANSTCFSDGFVQVTIDQAATVNAGADNSVCQSASPLAITLSGSSVGGAGSTAAWSIISGGGTLSSTAQTANPSAVTYTPAANFNGTVTLRLTTNDPAGACGVVTDDR